MPKDQEPKISQIGKNWQSSLSDLLQEIALMIRIAREILKSEYEKRN